LKNEAEPIPPDGGESAGRHVGDAKIAKPHISGIRPVEAAEQVQQRGFAAAGRARQRNELSGVDRQRDAAQCRHTRGAELVVLRNADDLGDGRCVHSASWLSAARRPLQGG
jgi:hypothetical protein